MTDYQQAWAAANFVASGAVFVICFCRVTASNRKVLRRVRAKFALLGSSFLMFGVSPFWDHWPGAVGFFVSFSTAVGLLAETYQWRGGPPDSVKLDTMNSELKDRL